jgi:hypothetical protein
LRRGELSDRLHRTLDVMKEIEAQTAGEVASETDGNGGKRWPNEAARNAEIQRRLAADAGYQALRAEADRLRQELRAADAEIEQVGRRHRSDANMAYLVASLLGAGLRAEAEAVLAAYGAKQEAPEEPQAQAEAEPPKADAQAEPKAQEPKTEPQAQGQGQAPKADGLETGTFTVLEVRAGKSEGTVRAYCEGPDGKTAVYAKNGAAKVLSGAAGRKVEVRFHRLDKGLFAVEARPVA